MFVAELLFLVESLPWITVCGAGATRQNLSVPLEIRHLGHRLERSLQLYFTESRSFAVEVRPQVSL